MYAPMMMLASVKPVRAMAMVARMAYWKMRLWGNLIPKAMAKPTVNPIPAFATPKTIRSFMDALKLYSMPVGAM